MSTNKGFTYNSNPNGVLIDGDTFILFSIDTINIEYKVVVNTIKYYNTSSAHKEPESSGSNL